MKFDWINWLQCFQRRKKNHCLHVDINEIDKNRVFEPVYRSIDFLCDLQYESK